jgi:hypothetical protein
MWEHGGSRSEPMCMLHIANQSTPRLCIMSTWYDQYLYYPSRIISKGMKLVEMEVCYHIPHAFPKPILPVFLLVSIADLLHLVVYRAASENNIEYENNGLAKFSSSSLINVSLTQLF